MSKKAVERESSTSSNDSDTSSSSEGDAEEVPEVLKEFATEEAALEGRKEGLKLFNEGKFEDALEYQAGVCKFFSQKYGDIHPKSALPYLDYGMTILNMIQHADSEESVLGALTGAKNDDVESCLMNLDCARLGFEKAEAENPNDVEIQMRLLECHDAMGSLQIEADQEAEAIKEFQAVLLINNALPKPNLRMNCATNFSMGQCYLRLNQYAEAQKAFKAAIKFGKTEGSGIDDAMIAEIQEQLEEAVELEKRGGIEDIKAEIRKQFPDEDSQVAAPDTVLKEIEQSIAAKPSAFVTPLPSELKGNASVSRSIPVGLTASIAPRETSNSISFIQPPSDGPIPFSGNVNIVPVKKKPKSQDNSLSVPAGMLEGSPSTKKRRTE